MRGTSATSVSNPSSLLLPLPSSPPPPLCGPCQAHRQRRASFFETCPLFVLKKSHFGARVVHTIRPQVPLPQWPLTWHLPLPSLWPAWSKLPWP